MSIIKKYFNIYIFIKVKKDNFLNAWPFGPRPDYRNMENIPNNKSEEVQLHMKNMLQQALERKKSKK